MHAPILVRVKALVPDSIAILRRYVLLLFLAAISFALLPRVRAVSPAPDGGYPYGNTAEGDNALFKLTTGINNKAIGYKALFSNTPSGDTTAIGYLAPPNT